MTGISSTLFGHSILLRLTLQKTGTVSCGVSTALSDCLVSSFRHCRHLTEGDTTTYTFSCKSSRYNLPWTPGCVIRSCWVIWHSTFAFLFFTSSRPTWPSLVSARSCIFLTIPSSWQLKKAGHYFISHTFFKLLYSCNDVPSNLSRYYIFLSRFRTNKIDKIPRRRPGTSDPHEHKHAHTHGPRVLALEDSFITTGWRADDDYDDGQIRRRGRRGRRACQRHSRPGSGDLLLLWRGTPVSSHLYQRQNRTEWCRRQVGRGSAEGLTAAPVIAFRLLVPSLSRSRLPCSVCHFSELQWRSVGALMQTRPFVFTHWKPSFLSSSPFSRSVFRLFGPHALPSADDSQGA